MSADLPAGTPQRVPRPRLIEVLDSVPPGGVGLVVAAAGWGKSVLLEQWMAERGGRGRPRPAVALVRLGADSSDPVVFARQLLGAIGRAVPELDPGLDELVSPGPGRLGPLFIAELSRQFRQVDRALDIVVDDAQALGSDPRLGFELADVISRLPAHVRLVLASRYEPDMGLHRLRAEGRLVELREADLAFTEDEAEPLVAAITGCEPECHHIGSLTARTGGWAVGLSLAAQSMRSMDDPGDFLGAFRGTDQFIAQYLTCEVLNRSKPEVRGFLLQTAVLPWLSPELCAEVVDGHDLGASADLLEQLRRNCTFLTPVDDHRNRFRYHELFSDLLRYQLEVECPGRAGDLRRRAAVWLERSGYSSDAADQLMVLDDHEGVLRFTRRHGAEYFARDESATVLRWLDAVARPQRPAELLVDHLAVRVAAHEGHRARDTYRLLKQRSDLTPGQTAAVEVLYACLGLDDLPIPEVQRACDDAEAGLASASDRGEEVTDFLGIGGPESVEVMALYMRAIVAFHLGRLHDATRRLEQTLGMPGAEYSLWKVSALATLALTRALAGRHNHAEADARAAIELTAEVASEHHHAVTHAHLALAFSGWDRLELGPATEHLDTARVCAERSGWSADRALHKMIQVRIDWATHGPGVPVRAPLFTASPVTLPPHVAAETAASRARMLMMDPTPGDRAALIDLVSEQVAPGPLEVDLALFDGDLAAVEVALQRWQPDPSDLRGLIGHRSRSALLDDQRGRRGSALEAITEAIRLAELEGIRALFAEVPGALGLLRSDDRLARSAFVRSILAATGPMVRSGGSMGSIDSLPEPLTRREADLLPFLPTRLTNAEIAGELFISLNTVKSHLRHIYWKFGVDNRDAAVRCASDLGLL